MAVQALFSRSDRLPAPTISSLGDGLHRLLWPGPSSRPLVSIVIPTRDGVKLLRTCVSGLIHGTAYDRIEILIVDNESTDPETLSYFGDVVTDRRVRVLPFAGAFDYSAINNYGVAQTSGPIVALLNNDIAVKESRWLDEMVAHAIRRDVGAVGAKLLYRDDTIQHAGVVLGIGGVASHIFKRQRADGGGYNGRLKVTQELSAVTAACVLIRRDVWDLVGGLDRDFPVAFNDVDLCLRIRSAGFRVIWTPEACLYHLESASRGREDDQAKRERFNKDKARMLDRWGPTIADDIFYNPNLSLRSTACEAAFPPRVKAPWRVCNRASSSDDVHP